MEFTDKSISGMITMEFALGLLLSVVILFFVTGVLNDSVDKMAANSNFKKITANTGTRTNYTSYGRDYTNSTIYVK